MSREDRSSWTVGYKSPILNRLQFCFFFVCFLRWSLVTLARSTPYLSAERTDLTGLLSVLSPHEIRESFPTPCGYQPTKPGLVCAAQGGKPRTRGVTEQNAVARHRDE